VSRFIGVVSDPVFTRALMAAVARHRAHHTFADVLRVDRPLRQQNAG
jgi:hypothetical protein